MEVLAFRQDLHNWYSQAQKLVECPICLEQLTDPVQTICRHVFCRGCIIRALRSEIEDKECERKRLCPLCNTKISSRALQDKYKEDNIKAFSLTAAVINNLELVKDFYFFDGDTPPRRPVTKSHSPEGRSKALEQFMVDHPSPYKSKKLTAEQEKATGHAQPETSLTAMRRGLRTCTSRSARSHQEITGRLQDAENSESPTTKKAHNDKIQPNSYNSSSPVPLPSISTQKHPVNETAQETSEQPSTSITNVKPLILLKDVITTVDTTASISKAISATANDENIMPVEMSSATASVNSKQVPTEIVRNKIFKARNQPKLGSPGGRKRFIESSPSNPYTFISSQKTPPVKNKKGRKKKPLNNNTNIVQYLEQTTANRNQGPPSDRVTNNRPICLPECTDQIEDDDDENYQLFVTPAESTSADMKHAAKKSARLHGSNITNKGKKRKKQPSSTQEQAARLNKDDDDFQLKIKNVNNWVEDLRRKNKNKPKFSDNRQEFIDAKVNNLQENNELNFKLEKNGPVMEQAEETKLAEGCSSMVSKEHRKNSEDKTEQQCSPMKREMTNTCEAVSSHLGVAVDCSDFKKHDVSTVGRKQEEFNESECIEPAPAEKVIADTEKQHNKMETLDLESSDEDDVLEKHLLCYQGTSTRPGRKTFDLSVETQDLLGLNLKEVNTLDMMSHACRDFDSEHYSDLTHKAPENKGTSNLLSQLPQTSNEKSFDSEGTVEYTCLSAVPQNELTTSKQQDSKPAVLMLERPCPCCHCKLTIDLDNHERIFISKKSNSCMLSESKVSKAVNTEQVEKRVIICREASTQTNDLENTSGTCEIELSNQILSNQNNEKESDTDNNNIVSKPERPQSFGTLVTEVSFEGANKRRRQSSEKNINELAQNFSRQNAFCGNRLETEDVQPVDGTSVLNSSRRGRLSERENVIYHLISNWNSHNYSQDMRQCQNGNYTAAETNNDDQLKSIWNSHNYSQQLITSQGKEGIVAETLQDMNQSRSNWNTSNHSQQLRKSQDENCIIGETEQNSSELKSDLGFNSQVQNSRSQNEKYTVPETEDIISSNNFEHNELIEPANPEDCFSEHERFSEESLKNKTKSQTYANGCKDDSSSSSSPEIEVQNSKSTFPQDVQHISADPEPLSFNSQGIDSLKDNLNESYTETLLEDLQRKAQTDDLKDHGEILQGNIIETDLMCNEEGSSNSWHSKTDTEMQKHMSNQTGKDTEANMGNGSLLSYTNKNIYDHKLEKSLSDQQRQNCLNAYNHELLTNHHSQASCSKKPGLSAISSQEAHHSPQDCASFNTCVPLDVKNPSCNSPTESDILLDAYYERNCLKSADARGSQSAELNQLKASIENELFNPSLKENTSSICIVKRKEPAKRKFESLFTSRSQNQSSKNSPSPSLPPVSQVFQSKMQCIDNVSRGSLSGNVSNLSKLDFDEESPTDILLQELPEPESVDMNIAAKKLNMSKNFDIEIADIGVPSTSRLENNRGYDLSLLRRKRLKSMFKRDAYQSDSETEEGWNSPNNIVQHQFHKAPSKEGRMSTYRDDTLDENMSLPSDITFHSSDILNATLKQQYVEEDLNHLIREVDMMAKRINCHKSEESESDSEGGESGDDDTFIPPTPKKS